MFYEDFFFLNLLLLVQYITLEYKYHMQSNFTGYFVIRYVHQMPLSLLSSWLVTAAEVDIMQCTKLRCLQQPLPLFSSVNQSNHPLTVQINQSARQLTSLINNLLLFGSFYLHRGDIKSE